MPDLYFVLFELILYFQFVLCFMHARKHGTAAVIRLFAGVVFGLLLEIGTLRQLNAYHYGHFLIMIFDLPLCIAVAWGSIVYSVMEFSNATSLPPWERSLLDGLLGLNIDIALDAVAIRLGFWDWGRGLSFQFFGVPYGNFLAWFLVVASFSFGYRLFEHGKGPSRLWLSGLAGILVGLTVIFIANAFMAYVLPLEYHGLLALMIPAIALLFVTLPRPRFHLHSVAPLAFFVPLLTILYVLVAGFVSSIYTRSPELLAVTVAMLFILLLLHWPSFRQTFSFRGGARRFVPYKKTPESHAASGGFISFAVQRILNICINFIARFRSPASLILPCMNACIPSNSPVKILT